MTGLRSTARRAAASEIALGALLTVFAAGDAAALDLVLPPTTRVEHVGAPAADGPAAPPSTTAGAEDGVETRRFGVFDRQSGVYRFSVYREEQDFAPGRSRAFRPEAAFVEGNLQWNAEREFENGWLWDVRLSGRHAEDPAVYREADFKLTDLRTTLQDPAHWELSFGNVVGSLTRYTFSRSYEGLAAAHHAKNVHLLLGGDLDVSVHYGRTQRAVEGPTSATPERLVWGTGLDWRVDDLLVFPKARLRLAGSGVDDVRASIDDPRGFVFNDNDVLGFAADVSFDDYGWVDLTGWTLAHEVAASSLRRGPVAGAFPRTGGWSYLFDLRYRRPSGRAYRWADGAWPAWLAGRLLSPVSSQYFVEKADRDFSSLLGSGAADQRRFSTNTRWDLARWGTVSTAGQWTRNDIAHLLRAHNRASMWSIDWRWKPFGGGGSQTPAMPYRSLPLKDLEMSLSFRTNTNFTTDRSRDLDVEDYRARFDWPIGPWRLGIDLSQQISIDHARARSATPGDRRAHQSGLTLSRSFTLPERFLFFPVHSPLAWWLGPERVSLEGWTLTPSVGLRQGRDNAFASAFRSTRFENVDLGLGVAPASRHWGLNTRWTLQDRDQATAAARTEDLQRTFHVDFRHQIPWIDGADVVVSWDRKTFNSNNDLNDLDSTMGRFDIRVPF